MVNYKRRKSIGTKKTLSELYGEKTILFLEFFFFEIFCF